MEIEFQKKWNVLLSKLKTRFGEELDVQSILFIIGLQELGMNIDRLTKDQKVDVIHVAVCSVLEQYGYYEYEGRDRDQWPHWKAIKPLPNLKEFEQEHLIKQGILDYMVEFT